MQIFRPESLWHYLSIFKRTVQTSFKNGNLITENGLLSKANLDPKLVQVAQLFVQDLINRARVEVQRKNPEQQVGITMYFYVTSKSISFKV